MQNAAPALIPAPSDPELLSADGAGPSPFRAEWVLVTIGVSEANAQALQAALLAGSIRADLYALASQDQLASLTQSDFAHYRHALVVGESSTSALQQLQADSPFLGGMALDASLTPDEVVAAAGRMPRCC